MILFETERFIIRQLTESDIEGFFDLQSDKVAMDMVPDKVMNLEEAIKDLKIRAINYTAKVDNFDVWAVIDNENADFLGTCAIVYGDPKGAEIGYRFRQKYWGKGVASEVTKGLINYIFNHTDYSTIIADVSQANIGSTKVLEKFLTNVGEGFCEETKTLDYHFELKKVDYIN